MTYADQSATTNYGNDLSIGEAFYTSGLRKEVTSENDHRRFVYQRGLLKTESHVGGPWSGVAVSRKQDDYGRVNGISVDGLNQVFSVSFIHDDFARPRISNAAGGSAYDYYSDTGALHTFRRGPLTTTCFYNNLGQLTDVQTTTFAGGGLSYSYSYDSRNRRKTRVANNGNSWFDLKYDNRNRLVSGQMGSGSKMSYAYESSGNRTSEGSSVIYATRSTLDQLVARRQTRRGYGVSGTVDPAATVQVFRLGGDPLGDQVPVNPVTGAYSASWLFTDTGYSPTRIEMMVRGTLPMPPVNGTAAPPKIADKAVWVMVPPFQESLSYDDAGRLSSDSLWSYTWDGAGRLTAMTRQPGTSTDPGVTAESLSFSYDADGRRTSKTHTTYRGNIAHQETSKTLWDGWLPVMEERTLNGVTQRRWFTWGRDISGSLDGAGGIGGLICIQEAGGRTLLPVEDGLGNITAVVDSATGNVVANYNYGPYGEDLGSSGEVDACPFRYQSKYLDAETGLSYFGYRYYSPKLGRWISRDPLGEEGGFNLYAYCGNDPVNKHDYLGMDVVAPGASAVFTADPSNVEALLISFAVSVPNMVPRNANIGMPYSSGYNFSGWEQSGYRDTGKFITVGHMSKSRLGELMHAQAPMRALLDGVLDDLRATANQRIGLHEDGAFWEGAGGLLRMVPGGSTGVEAAEGNYGRAGLYFAGDVALTLTGAKLLKNASGAGLLLRSGAIAGAGGLYNTAVEIGGARYDEGAAYQHTWGQDVATLASNTGRSAFIGAVVPWAFGKASSLVNRWHTTMNERYTWGTPPGGHWSQGVSNQLRTKLGLVGTPTQLHHWLIPQNQWGRFVPNYIKNRRWNIMVAADRAAHARIDTAFSVRGVDPYPLMIRPWMGMPNWARVSTVGGGVGLGYGIFELIDDE